MIVDQRPPFLPGDFVWSNFPFRDSPDRPGPTRHVAFIVATFTRREAFRATNATMGTEVLVVGVYTSSQVRKFDDSVPIGTVQVNAHRASQAGGQKPFFIDTRVRAFLPFTRTFFPEIEQDKHGLIGRADPGLLRQVVRNYGLINQRHPEQIINVGPYRPR